MDDWDVDLFRDDLKRAVLKLHKDKFRDDLKRAVLKLHKDKFRDDLKRAVLKLHKDKASRVETYLNCEDKEYKVIIEEVKKDV